MEVTLDLDETPLLLSSGLRRDTGGGLCPLGWSILKWSSASSRVDKLGGELW